MTGQIKRLGSPGPSQKIYRVPDIPLLRGHVLYGAPLPLDIQLKYKVLSNTLLCKYVQNINQSEANDCMHRYVSLENSKYIPGIGTVILISFHIQFARLWISQPFCSWRQIKMKVVEPQAGDPISIKRSQTRGAADNGHLLSPAHTMG